MKKDKKKKSKKAQININENIIVSEHVSYNSVLLDDIDFLSRTFEMNSTLLNKQIDLIKDKIDSLNELGEMESLRLQMAMDRMSKLMETLSNITKKISDTDSEIVQNLK